MSQLIQRPFNTGTATIVGATNYPWFPVVKEDLPDLDWRWAVWGGTFNVSWGMNWQIQNYDAGPGDSMTSFRLGVAGSGVIPEGRTVILPLAEEPWLISDPGQDIRVTVSNYDRTLPDLPYSTPSVSVQLILSAINPKDQRWRDRLLDIQSSTVTIQPWGPPGV